MSRPAASPSGLRAAQAPQNLSVQVYERIKQEIFDFRLIPGERFSEGELALRMGVSRTPVREALNRLQSEGLLEVMFRSGWQVRPLDFAQIDEFYDARVVLELAAVKRLCDLGERTTLAPLKSIWLVPVQDRILDGKQVAALDEQFHTGLVAATGNRELARMHREVTERIRIVRRLDFTQPARIEATYAEHGRILRAILQRKVDQAQMLLKAHIEASKTEVRKITLHMLYEARRNGA